MIRLHHMVLHTKVLGPGIRSAIWMQGCNRSCKGCMSPASRPLDGGRLVAVSSIVDALSHLKDIEGVTISGGEPFLQPEPLYRLLQAIHDDLGLGVIVYTGYALSELHAFGSVQIDKMLAQFIDLLIDGEYIDELNDGAALKGSSNQQVHFLSDRYLSYAEQYRGSVRNTEIIATNKDMFLIGIPPKKTLEEWKHVVSEFSETDLTQCMNGESDFSQES